MPIQTFTWTPNFPLKKTAHFKTLISSGELGKERRRSKASLLPTYDLTFLRLKTADADALFAFYLARKGAYEAFYWTPPGESQGLYRFERDDLSRDWFMSNRHKLTLTLRNVTA